MKYILGYMLGDYSQSFTTESVYELEQFIEKLLIIKQTDNEYLQLNISKVKDASSTNSAPKEDKA